MIQETFKHGNWYTLVISPTKRIGNALYIGKNRKNFVFINRIDGKLNCYRFEEFDFFHDEIWINFHGFKQPKLSELEEKFLGQFFDD